MGNFPIVVEDKFVTINASSRLNFGKIYTVEHNIKVRNVGKISKESLPRIKTALIRSMGFDTSDMETETETETEGMTSRPIRRDSPPRRLRSSAVIQQEESPKFNEKEKPHTTEA